MPEAEAWKSKSRGIALRSISETRQKSLEQVSRSWTTRRDVRLADRDAVGRSWRTVRPTSASGWADKKNSNERTKEHEIQFFAEANLTPRNVARFGYPGRQRLSGASLARDAAPRRRSGLRATSAFGLARGYARLVQRLSPRNKKAQ